LALYIADSTAAKKRPRSASLVTVRKSGPVAARFIKQKAWRKNQKWRRS